MFEAVIGLEIHLQLSTKSKMFSSVSAEYFGSDPNTCVDPFTLGLPGTLPTINKAAVEHAIMFGLALNCDVSGFTQFHRKNYFYPDAPRNYQISQFDRPIARDGFVEIGGKHVRIRRAHLEDDAGKNLHPAFADFTLVDLNRAGVGLIEMVTEPDIDSPEHARDFLYRIQAIAQALGISDASPEEGKMRCDVNVSVRRPGEPFGTKVEVKNLNSFRSVQRALYYEIERQSKLIESGGKVTQDTLGWDEGAGKTFHMRTKEGEADYRYFPEPDLPPLFITQEWIDEIKAKMPKLPEEKKVHYISIGVREYDADIISHDKNLSNFFESALKNYQNSPQIIANWLIGDVLGWLNNNNININESKIKPDHLANMVKLIDDGVISGKMAKDILPEIMLGTDPSIIIEQKGLKQVSDPLIINQAIEKVLLTNTDLVEKIKNGKPQAVNALFGQIMKETGGKANPELVRELLNKAVGLT